MFNVHGTLTVAASVEDNVGKSAELGYTFDTCFSFFLRVIVNELTKDLVVQQQNFAGFKHFSLFVSLLKMAVFGL
jgi:hypothetical protein